MRFRCFGALAALAAASSAATAAPAPAPDCRLTLGGTAPASLASLKGEVVYLDFWASWCTSCLASFPFMTALNSQLGGEGLKVIGVNLDQRPADANRFLARRKAGFPIALGDNQACARAFRVAAMPSTYLIDRHGVVRMVHKGFDAAGARQLKTAAQQLLAER